MRPIERSDGDLCAWLIKKKNEEQKAPLILAYFCFKVKHIAG